MWRKQNRRVNIDQSGFLALSVFILFLVFQFWGCSSVPRHRTLSFFFDGVPDPADSIKKNTTGITRNSDTTRLKSVISAETADQDYHHKPYKDKQCGSCHDRDKMGKFVLPQPELCYQCHNDYSRKYKVVHGPVGSGYCTACHHNHMSKFEKILKKSARDLCLYCHNYGQVMKNKAHKEIADADCIKCHNPHGGANNALLR